MGRRGGPGGAASRPCQPADRPHRRPAGGRRRPAGHAGAASTALRDGDPGPPVDVGGTQPGRGREGQWRADRFRRARSGAGGAPVHLRGGPVRGLPPLSEPGPGAGPRGLRLPPLAGVRAGGLPAWHPRGVCVPPADRGRLPRRSRRLPRTRRTGVVGRDRRRPDVRRHRPDHARGPRPVVRGGRGPDGAGRHARSRPRGLPGTGHGDGRPRGQPRRRPWSGSGPTPSSRDDPSPTSPATSSRAGFAWSASCRARSVRVTLGESEGSPA